MCNCNCGGGGSGIAGLETIVVGQLTLVAHRLTGIEAYIREMNLSMATSKELLTELVGTLNQTNTTVARIYTEVTTRTADLENQIDILQEKVRNETVTEADVQALRDSLETVNAGLKQIDDLNTDEVEVPETTDPEPAPAPGDEVTDGQGNPVL